MLWGAVFALNGLDPKGQVPMNYVNFKSYALLGSGRVARHFSYYLKTLNLPVLLWSRNGSPEFNSFPDSDPNIRLRNTLALSSHVLFAVRDESVAELALPWKDSGRALVHFSGALQIPGVHAAHPLMTFSAKLG